MVEWSGGGGIGHYAFLLTEALAREGVDVVHFTRRGHELSGLSPHHAERLMWPAAPALPRGMRRSALVGGGRTLGWVRSARAVLALRRRRPVVHIQTLDHVSEILFGVLCRAAGARVLATVHNVRPHDATARHAFTQTVGLRVPHGIIVHAEEAAAEMRRRAAPGTPVAVLGHPSYRRLVELTDRPEPVRGPVPRVGALGMIRPYKGLEFVIDTFRAVHADGLPCELRVAGRPSDVPWVRSLLDGLPPGSVTSRLEYLPLSDFVDEVLACDVLLLGHRSLSESGIAQLALGAGVPVIGPRVGALARLLADRPEWLYEPEDHAGAARRLRTVLSDVAERARRDARLGARAERDRPLLAGHGATVHGAGHADPGASIVRTRSTGVVVTSSTFGGAEKYLLDIYGHDRVRSEFGGTLLGGLPGWDAQGLPAIGLGFGPKWSRRNAARALLELPTTRRRGLRALEDFVRGEDPAFMHLQFKREQVLFSSPLSRRVPVLWTEHGGLPRFAAWKAVAPSYRRAARSASTIICVAQHVADDLAALIGPRAPRLTVIEGGIDPSWTSPASRAEREAARSRLRVPQSAVVVASVARLVPIKRVGTPPRRRPRSGRPVRGRMRRRTRARIPGGIRTTTAGALHGVSRRPTRRLSGGGCHRVPQRRP